LNLINNAFYAVNERQKNEKDSEYKPRVTLTTKKQADQVVIEVADNGTGMPEQVKEKIFQPFFTTKPTGEGTGLGLSLSYDIVTKGHGGTMEVETTEGEGTEFVIMLPITNS
jgi:signal transduction histidine kinase